MSEEYVYPDPAPIAPGEAVRLARGVIERFTKPGLIDRALVLGELSTSASRLDRGMFPDGHDRVRTRPSSDSITEQAARAAYIADAWGNEEFAARAWDESVREPNATKDYWRRIATAALAHQAPATEDEAALYGKYRVEKVSDPTGKHAHCRYFVLDPAHDPRAVPAIRAYADTVRADSPDLAAGLDEWVGRAPATEDASAESFAAELITMSVLGPDKDCDGDHEDGCCELDADRLPDGHLRLTFLVTDGTRPVFGEYRVTREVNR